MLLFRVSRKNSRQAESKKNRVEKFLLRSFIITFTLLIVVQAALTNPAVRTSLAMNDELEGKPLGMEEYLYNEGKISLKITDAQSSPLLKVLVNGDVVASFLENPLEIAVRDGDVVEIDGSDVGRPISVAVVSKSDNISDDCLYKSVTVNSNVMRIVRIRMK